VAQKYGPAALDVAARPALWRPPICSCVLRHRVWESRFARHCLAQQELASGALVRPFETRAIDLGVAVLDCRSRGSTPREAVKVLAAWLRREAERAPIDPQSSP